MSSLFRNLNDAFANKKENAIKEAIINQLGENVENVNDEFLNRENPDEFLEQCEATSALCTNLEALFLHGLKDSLLWQAFNALAGGPDERRPEPSFWTPLLVFLHKDVIDQIQHLSQITSEIGQCRAWIRLSLQESLMCSYLMNMRSNTSALSPYYKKHALLKDRDGLQLVIEKLQPLEASIQLKFNINSSLLNQWTEYSLQLSGLWTPTLKLPAQKVEPTSSGIDIAHSLGAEAIDIPMPQPVSTNVLFAESISNSPFKSNAGIDDLNQSERRKLFLENVEEMDLIAEEEQKAKAANVVATEAQTDEQASAQGKPESKPHKKQRKSSNVEMRHNDDRHSLDLPLNRSSTHGNSLNNLMKNSWCSSDGSDIASMNSSTQNYMRSMSTSSTNSTCTPLDDYNALLARHENTRSVDWTVMWEKFLLQNNASALGLSTEDTANAGNLDDSDTQTLEGSDDEGNRTDRFELIPKFGLESNFDVVELQEMVEQLCKLAREPGLDAQGFLCKLCQRPLGIGYSKIQVCGFSGNYFCDNCMDAESVQIPARIIFNWDFRKYKISKRAAAFLAEFRTQPFIDLRMLNPYIYNVAEAMAELQSLRIRLNFIRAYLITCSEDSFAMLKKEFYGREYLYEHIHQYSIGDLYMIQRGLLNQQLHKAYKLGESHVLKCALCSVKGFICEKCNSPRVLYPFHIETTFRCETCGACFHAQCLNEQQPCPKCQRKRERANRLSSLEEENEQSLQQLELDEASSIIPNENSSNAMQSAAETDG